MKLIHSIRKKGEANGTPPEGSKTPTPKKNGSRKQSKRRKPEETLASVVQESTANAAIDLLSRNDPFVLPGGNSWVALALPVENIGGLSRKHQRDEDKGSLIELINHDHIQVITISSLLQEEVLGIIPTPQTLERMGEYSMLTQAPYHWIVLGQSRDRQELVVNAVMDKEAFYSEAVAISNGSRSLADQLPHVWAQAEAIEETTLSKGTVNSADSPPNLDRDASHDRAGMPVADDSNPLTASVTTDSTPEEGVEDEGEEGVPLVPSDLPTSSFDEPAEDIPAPSSEIFSDEETGVHSEEVYEDDGDYSEEVYEDDGDYSEEVYEDDGDHSEEARGNENRGFATTGQVKKSPSWLSYAEQNRDRKFTEAQVRESIARRFLSNDLELEIPLTEFEATFDPQAPSVQLDFSATPTDWLSGQIALMAKQANAELEKLHSDHRRELRQSFVETMSLHTESVIREVDDQSDGSVYRRLLTAADQEFAELKAKAPEEISTQRAEIIQRYEKEADDRGEVAAAQAKQMFWDRSRPELERKLADVASGIERRNEERYNHQRQLVLEMRRKDAQTRTQLGTTYAFRLLSEREAEQRKVEMELLKQWNTKLTRLIDENRKHDIARAESLAEQLRLDTRIEELQNEYAQRVEELTEQNKVLARQLEEDLEHAKNRAVEHLREREEEWKREAKAKDEKLRSAQGLHKEHYSQAKAMVEDMHEQYRRKVEEVKRDRISHSEELERVDRNYRRLYRILFFVVIIGILIFTAAGAIVGWTANHMLISSADTIIAL